MIFTRRKYNSLDVVKIPFKLAPSLMILYFILTALIAIIPTSLLPVVIAQFIDSIVEIVNNNQDRSLLYLPLFNLLLIIGISSLLDPMLQLIETKIQLSLEKDLLPELVKKQAQLPYQYIEDASSWELVDRMTSEMLETFMEGLQGYSSIFQSAVTIISVASLLLRYVWWGSFILILTSIPLFIISVYWAKKIYHAKVDTQQYERRYSYYSDHLLTSREAVLERELYGYSEPMIERYYDIFTQARDIQLNVLLKSYISTKSTGIMLIVLSFLILIPTVNALLFGQITSGIFTGIVTAIFSLIDQMGKDLQNAVKYIAEAQEYMQELTFLLSLDDVAGAIDRPDSELFQFNDLEFVDVWFKYPHAEDYILKGISFKIEAGDHCAFVGKNGAGKTTITKLLIGLYDDYDGEIFVNGRELREYPQSTIKSMFSVVFQDFTKYDLSLKDNIYIGGIETHLDINRLAMSIELSGLQNLIKKLPEGMDTDLGKLSGTSRELSGGQWQRMAIARSFYNRAPMKILDEPTSALDPLAESKLYHMYSQVMTDKTSLLITHRLGAVKLVDKIFVIDEGQVVESGDHHTFLT